LRELSGRVAEIVRQAGLRIVYTPFLQVTLARNAAVDPILPRAAIVHGDSKQNYYHAAFGREVRSAYGLVDEQDADALTDG
jgi:hypothetical protein